LAAISRSRQPNVRLYIKLDGRTASRRGAGDRQNEEKPIGNVRIDGGREESANTDQSSGD